MQSSRPTQVHYINCLDHTYCHFNTHVAFNIGLAVREHMACSDQQSSVGLTCINSDAAPLLLVFAVALESPRDESVSVSLCLYHLIWSDVAICTFLPHKCERQHASWYAGNMFSPASELRRLITAGKVQNDTRLKRFAIWLYQVCVAFDLYVFQLLQCHFPSIMQCQMQIQGRQLFFSTEYCVKGFHDVNFFSNH